MCSSYNSSSVRLELRIKTVHQQLFLTEMNNPPVTYLSVTEEVVQLSEANFPNVI